MDETHDLSARLVDAEETLRAIREGEADALVVNGPHGPQVYTLKSADEPYRRLIERMQEGAVTLTPEGLILYCNPAFSRLIGHDVPRLVGEKLQDLILAKDRELVAGMLAAAALSSAWGEVTLKGSGGASIPVRVSFSTVDSGPETNVCLVVTDLTEQKRNEEILASEQLARLILKQAAQPIFVIDEQARIVRASDEAAELAGRPILRHTMEETFPLTVRRRSDRPQEWEPLRQEELLNAGREGRVLRDWEVCFPRNDAPDVELLLNSAPLWSAMGTFYGCVVTLVDITERGRAARAAQEAAAAHALNAGLLQGQEDERRRLARELHDGLNQKLVALTLRIRGMQNRLDPKFHAELLILERWAEEVCEETRRVSHELHPATLEHLGLVASLKGLCREFSDQSGVKTDFAAGKLPGEISHEVGTCLYRVAQEALSNIGKHAPGSDAGVHLFVDGEFVCLRITDRGKGFDLDAAMERGGLGLTSMQERLRLLGGRLDIESKPGQGAVVTARVPQDAGRSHTAKA